MRRVMTVLDAFFDANMQRNENKSEHNRQKSKVFIRYWLGIISKQTRLSIAFLLFFDLAFLALTPAFDAEIRLL